MIATILPSSSNFHAVAYNERKVAMGVARLLEIKNFGHVGILGQYTAKDLQDYLMAYSSQNPRIRKAQFHLAISCKGHEKTDEELLLFAHEYLNEMGYGEKGQPLLVYSHSDTGNTHIHIVTSRINPDGKKISDSHERVRSQAVLNKLLGKDVKAKASEDLSSTLSYSYSTFAQFKAIITSMGYEVYEKNGMVSVKRDGAVQLRVKLNDITSKFSNTKMEKARRRQLRAILAKYRDTCADRKELQSELKRKFGIDLVFFGRQDSPYGYMIVDHNRKIVFNGAWVLKLDNLLDFATPQERFDRIDSFIDRLLEHNPKMDTWSINEKLFRSHAYIKRGVIYFNGQSRPLKDFMGKTILRNDKIKRVEDFKPRSVGERNLLCRIYNIDDSSLIELSNESTNVARANAINDMRDLFNDETVEDLWVSLKNSGFRIFHEGEEWYAVDFSRHVTFNLEEEGFDVKRLHKHRNKNRRNDHSPKNKRPAKRSDHKAKIHGLKDAGTGHGEKREWEVGYKGDYDRIDDESSLKV